MYVSLHEMKWRDCTAIYSTGAKEKHAYLKLKCKKRNASNTHSNTHSWVISMLINYKGLI